MDRQETVLSAPRAHDAEGSGGVAVSPVMERLFPGTSQSQPVDDAAGIRVGHFIIERRIGSGGMGTVFLAHDERLQRPVALKVLAPHQTADPGSVQRFQNEARSAARLDHDHIARVFFYGEDQGLHYIAYEFVQGTTLRDLIRYRGRLDPAQVVSYAVQLATALCHTSASGVVHRDIKPSNIIITPQGKAKLVDLGLARKESLEESAQLTVAGTTLGTFDYISPEQAKDPRGVDVRSDIYSLGGTLYHALTGEPPFPEGTVLQRLLDHQDKPPADPALKNRRVTPQLSAVVRKMMAGDARKRYQTAEELLRDLMIVANTLGLHGVAGEAALPPTWPRLPRGSRVQLVGWSITMVALVGAVVTLSLRPDLLRVATRQTPAAVTARNQQVENSAEPDRANATSSNEPEITASPSIKPGLSNPPDHVPTAAEGPPASSPRPADALDTQSLFRDDRLDLPPPIVSSPGTSAVDPERTAVKSAAAVTNARSTEEGARPLEAAGEKPLPYAIAGSGKAFDSLDAACAEIRDQGTIELQYDGRLPMPQRPLRLINKRITLQAAKGRQPVLWFAPKDSVIDNNQSRMIFIAGGALSVMNVDLELQVPNHLSTADLWALISCARPDQVRLFGVAATIVNPGHHAAALLEVAQPVNDGMSKMNMMKDGMPVSVLQLRVDRSILRGDCSAVRIRDAVALRCDFEQSLFAVGEWLIQTELPLSAPANPPRLSIELDHNTCLLGNGLYSAMGGDDLTRRQVMVEFVTHDNIFASASNQPLISQQLGGDQMDYRSLVSWSGDRNYFDHLEQFWVVHMPGMGLRGMDFDAWCSFWGPAETAGSQNIPIVWQQPWKLRRWSEIAPEDAALDRTAAANPPVSASADGTDAGAALDQLPVDSSDR